MSIVDFIRDNYKILYKSPAVKDDLSNADEFLLGEKHNNLGHALINAHFINAFAQKEDVVLLESVPLMQPIHKDQMPSSIWLEVEAQTRGWDIGNPEKILGSSEFNQFFSHMTSSSKKKVGMAFDIGHANIFQDFRNNYVGYLNALGPYVPVNHLHFHENSGEEDSHDCIFSTQSEYNDLGIRTVIEMLIERNCAANIILEQWPQPRSLLVDARDRLQKIIDQERTKFLKRRSSEN